MKQVTLSIPDAQFLAFMELIKKFDFIKVSKIKTQAPLTDSERQLAESLQSALKEVEQHQQGKIELTEAKSFFEQLKLEQTAS